jgi:YD repeat-containing protein
LQPFTYDDDGNLTGDGKWTYTWDAENRLVQMETASATLAAVAPRRITYAYDDLGRLRGRHVYDLDTSTTISRNCHVYDEWNLIGELDASSTLVRSYAWGLDLSDSEHGAGGVGGLLLVRDTTDTFYTTYDGNGNVTGLVDPSDGSTAAVYEYDPFGNLLRATGPMAEMQSVPVFHQVPGRRDGAGLLRVSLARLRCSGGGLREESAGENRHETGGESPPRVRCSEPPGPDPCVGVP